MGSKPKYSYARSANKFGKIIIIKLGLENPYIDKQGT